MDLKQTIENSRALEEMIDEYKMKCLKYEEKISDLNKKDYFYKPEINPSIFNVVLCTQKFSSNFLLPNKIQITNKFLPPLVSKYDRSPSEILSKIEKIFQDNGYNLSSGLDAIPGMIEKLFFEVKNKSKKLKFKAHFKKITSTSECINSFRLEIQERIIKTEKSFWKFNGLKLSKD